KLGSRPRATVPIYYESWLAKLVLPEELKPEDRPRQEFEGGRRGGGGRTEREAQDQVGAADDASGLLGPEPPSDSMVDRLAWVIAERDLGCGLRQLQGDSMILASAGVGRARS